MKSSATPSSENSSTTTTTQLEKDVEYLRTESKLALHLEKTEEEYCRTVVEHIARNGGGLQGIEAWKEWERIARSRILMGDIDTHLRNKTTIGQFAYFVKVGPASAYSQFKEADFFEMLEIIDPDINPSSCERMWGEAKAESVNKNWKSGQIPTSYLDWRRDLAKQGAARLRCELLDFGASSEDNLIKVDLVMGYLEEKIRVQQPIAELVARAELVASSSNEASIPSSSKKQTTDD